MSFIISSLKHYCRSRVTSAAVRSIASATFPCLGSKKSKDRPSLKKKKKPKDEDRFRSGLIGLARHQAEIEYLKNRLEQMANKSDADLPKAPRTMPTGPSPSISEDEVKEKLGQLWLGIPEIIVKQLSQSQKEQLLEDRYAIEMGGLSWGETRAVIFHCIEKEDIDFIAKQKIIQAIRGDRPELVFQALDKNTSEATRERILKRILEPPLADFSPIETRIQDLYLSAIPPYQKREFLAAKRDLFFRRIFDNEANASGRSMLPTLPEEPNVYYGTPITHDMTGDVVVNDIVIFVAIKSDGHTDFAGKRVVGLAGDVVEDIKGKRMVVPSGYFWAVGDNREHSYDSRHYGAVPLSNLRFLVDLDRSLSPPADKSFFGNFFELLVSSYKAIKRK